MTGSTKTTIGGYLIERLQEQGVGHVFGVPGDFVLGFMRQLEASPLRLINTSDEQGAGFAADAYARLRGLGAVCVTYGVGGLKIANTTGEAYAEKSPVVVISGAPSMDERRRHPLIHHKVRSYDTQYRVFQQLTAAATVLDDPECAASEIDRVLAIAKAYSQPVYIELPRDMVDVPVDRPAAMPAAGLESDPRTLAAALAEAVDWINRAERPVIMFGVEVVRFGMQDLVMRFIEASGIPAVVTPLDKGAIQECHPSFVGVYAGALGRDDVREYVEGSDCLIMLGTLLTDFNLGIYTARIDPARCIHATRERLAMGLHTFERVGLEDFVAGLAAPEAIRRRDADHPRVPETDAGRDEADGRDPITVARFFRRLESFLTDEMIVLADPGDALFGSIDLPVQGARAFLSPAFYASLGFAVPAAIGAQCAAPDARPVVLVGDGAFQMTGMELSTCVKHGLDPLVFVLNNGGYTTERLILDGGFNDIQPWDYGKLPGLLGGGHASVVETVADLESALEAASIRDGQFSLVDVRLAPSDVSQALVRLGARLKGEAEAKAAMVAGAGRLTARVSPAKVQRPTTIYAPVQDAFEQGDRRAAARLPAEP
jgi:TPP-dependent 2-oxoacid decarboxylase